MPGTSALQKTTPQNTPTVLPVGDGFGGTFLANSQIGPPYLYKQSALAPWVVSRGSYLSARQEILYIGDSTVAGIGSDGSSSGLESTTSILNSVPGQLRSLLAAKTFIDPGEGVIIATDTRWVLSGASKAGGFASGPVEEWLTFPNASATATITLSGTDFEVWWHKTGSLGAPTMTLDGSAVTVAAGSTGQNKVTIPTVADGSHTLVITGNAAQSRVGMVVVRRNPTKGIGVHRMGIGGLVSDAGAGGSIASTRADLFAVEFTSLTPALTIIQFGINDWLTQVPLATYQANMQLMITHLTTTLGKPVLLSDANMTFHDPTSIGPLTRAQYSAVLRGLCDSNSKVAYLSQASLLGTYVNALSQGMMIAASSHPNAGGYSALAQGLGNILMHPRLGTI